MHVFTAYSLALSASDITKCEDFICLKYILSLSVWDVLNLATWYSMYIRRTHIKSLLKVFATLENQHGYNISGYKSVINILLGVLLLLCLALFGTIIFLLLNDAVETQSWFMNLTFISNISSTFPVKVALAVVYITGTRIFRSVTPLLLTLFYVQCCLVLSHVIKETSEQLCILRSSEDKAHKIQNFIRHYNIAHGLVSLTESALSLQVFWLMSSHFSVIFSTISKILGFYEHNSVVYNTENYSLTSLQNISFFLIIYFASKVNSEDVEMREAVKNIAFQLSLVKEYKECSDLQLRFIQSKRELVLTAWGVFRFTRNFLFTSAGVLITYNLLILQLNTYHENTIL
ncbi:hypothetical protein AVEN_182049-1 [Araneus ventricosus]|uniref:Gustatory receptor n=1 Tax=Araneus ventricosus TaxID=182803 RepID=A0A4Y2M8C5_ARAVE|nr:hypothetical protein AVEN_182049-1 [Araneus ventricosus]